ncbi:MAG: serine/threonine protein kinase, partial [Myxococcales bacterium]|nr:serine/threonine protein kinase [Myxococcales bacterium]
MRGPPPDFSTTPSATVPSTGDAADDSADSYEGLAGGDTVDPAIDPPERPRRIGRYTVLGELGSGGMGVVFKAWDPALDRIVALKVMRAAHAATRRQVKRFLNEARAVARLDDPNIVALHDIGVVDGSPYFTMAFVDGVTLAGHIAEKGRLDPTEACRIVAGVARGLAHAHSAGIVHRDVKPGNILLEEGRPLLVDFGVARFLESEDGTQTRTGQVIGTPAYMAPEQAQGDHDRVDARSDVFALGAVLFHAITGKLPVYPTDDRGLPVEVPATPRRQDGLPTDVIAICLRALHRSPARRYVDALDMAADLDRFLRGEPVVAALPGSWRRLGWWLRRHRTALIAAGLTALALAAVFGGREWLRTRAAQAEAEVREAQAETALSTARAQADRLRAAGSDAAADAVPSPTLPEGPEFAAAREAYNAARYDEAARRFRALA